MTVLGSRSALSSVVEALSRFDQTSAVTVTGLSVTHDGYGGPTAVTLDMSMYGHADAEEVTESLGFGSSSQKQKWIAASKSKPKSDDVVLVCRGQDVSAAQYWGKKYGWSVSPSPTHWMPMPLPATEAGD